MFKKAAWSWMIFTSAILLLVGTPPPSVQAAEAWSIVTSSTGSNPYVLGSVIASVLNGKQDRIRLSAQTSGGYNENLSLIALQKATIGMPRASAVRYVHEKHGVNLLACQCAIDRAVLLTLMEYWVPEVTVGGVHELIGNALVIDGENERTTDLRGRPIPGREVEAHV